MFFSIIIPTYNPRKYIIKLLDSITKNKCLDEIEIIISDDQSTESFDNIIQQFNNLNIKKIINPIHSGFPRLGRQRGREEATGKWIVFADQDDYFIDNTFDIVKYNIQKENIHAYFITDIYIEWEEENNRREIGSGTNEWTHGKFYEREFLNKYNINYQELNYSEDIDICVQMLCAIQSKGLQAYRLQTPFYVWHRHSDSLCNNDYHINMFPNYIRATLNTIVPYLEQYKENKQLYLCYRELFTIYFLRLYFYSQGLEFLDKREKILEAVSQIEPLYKRFIKVLNYHNDDFNKLLISNFIYLYNEIRYNCFIQRPFIEQISIFKFINVYLS